MPDMEHFFSFPKLSINFARRGGGTSLLLYWSLQLDTMPHHLDHPVDLYNFIHIQGIVSPYILRRFGRLPLTLLVPICLYLLRRQDGTILCPMAIFPPFVCRGV